MEIKDVKICREIQLERLEKTKWNGNSQKNDDETKNKLFKNIDSYIDALRVETSYTYKQKWCSGVGKTIVELGYNELSYNKHSVITNTQL